MLHILVACPECKTWVETYLVPGGTHAGVLVQTTKCKFCGTTISITAISAKARKHVHTNQPDKPVDHPTSRKRPGG
jgi:hypothetical protein